MGVCGSDIFQTLAQKYGKQLGTFAAIEKSKTFLDNHTGKVKQQVQGQIKNLKKEAFNNLDQKEVEVEKNFQSSVDSIEKKSPGALKQAENITRKPKEDILGLNDIKKNLAGIRAGVDQQFNEQEQTILQEIDTQKEGAKGQMNKQKPHIPMLSSMPESRQKEMLKKAQTKFKPQFDEVSQKMEGQIKDKLNLEKYTKMLEGINPSKRVNEIAGGSKQKFQKALNSIPSPGFFC